jgi:hypothetical protein
MKVDGHLRILFQEISKQHKSFVLKVHFFVRNSSPKPSQFRQHSRGNP